ncbi:uncharacterized protein LOC121419538 [Lytechinus variegatus]|uniref:uncharacterized protein LOC121419538 n=1 Tax=Lytechinus variegatus TaxID=7654 RepID=UPI001BB21C6D|nr:uncharacterized protein LOC121419538 [Lytechinus variegatus]
MNVKDRSVNISMNIRDRSVNRSMNVKDISVNRNMNVKDRSVNRSMNVRDRSVNRSMNVKDRSVNRSMNVKDRSVNRSMTVRDRSVNRSMNVKDRSVNRSMNVKDRSVNRSMNVKDRSVNRSMNVKDRRVNIKQKVDADEDPRYCDVDGENATVVLQEHPRGPEGLPMISTPDTLTVGKTSQLNCTVYHVYPAPIIEWFIEPGEENITMNASIHSNPDNISSLFNATSSLLFTPTTNNHGENLTCRLSPSVPNVWKSRNVSVTLNIEGDLSPSDEIRVENVTSSSLTLSWDVDNVTLEYCNCSYASSDILKTTDPLNCRFCNEPIRVNGTSYDLTGLEPFQWYNLTLKLTGVGVVASKLASTAPPVPEYYGVIMTFSQENSKLKISRMLQLNDPIPSDLCFSVVKTQDQRDNCSLSNCLELGINFRYTNTSIENVSDFGLVSSGRGLCSVSSRPIILNSTAGVLNMAPVFILIGVVAASEIFLFLSVVAIIVLCLRLKQNRNRMQVQGHKGGTSKGTDEEDPTGQGVGSNYESLDGPRGGISLYTGLNFPAKVAGSEEDGSGSRNHPTVVGEEDPTRQGVGSNYESLDGTRGGISLYTGLNFPAKANGSDEEGSESRNRPTVAIDEDYENIL